MSHVVTRRIFTRHRSAKLVILLFAVLIAAGPVSVQAQCIAGWDVGGEWEFNQAGQKQRIKLRLTQKGQVITGTAVLPDGKITPRAPGISGAFGTREDLLGTVDGYIAGDHLLLNISWNNNTTGVYSGRILPSGRVEGKGHEKKSPSIQVSWDSAGTLTCPPPLIYKPSQQPQKPPPKILKSGRKPRTEPMKVPGIIAGQPIFSHPAAASGFVVLSWDAGPDNPYAEVWYKVNGGDEIRLIEKGKGSLQVPIERYKPYTYILTDAGKTLATVTVVGN